VFEMSEDYPQCFQYSRKGTGLVVKTVLALACLVLANLLQNLCKGISAQNQQNSWNNTHRIST
jgi:hypothetical protein